MTPRPGVEIYREETVMDFLEEAEKLAGAVAAVEGLKKVDPKRFDIHRSGGCCYRI